MTRKPKHNAISENDLLDLLEGRLPLERIEELEPHLRADPDLAARVKAMSHDREAHRASSGVTYSAPAGLLTGAFDRVEREALLSDRRAAAAPSSLPKIAGGVAAGVVLTAAAVLIARFALLPAGARDAEIAMDVPAGAAAAEESLRAAEGDGPAAGALASAVAPIESTTGTPTAGLGPATDSPATAHAAAEEAPQPMSRSELARAARLAQAGTLRLVATPSSVGEALALGSLGPGLTVRTSDGLPLAAPPRFAMSHRDPTEPEHPLAQAPGEYSIETPADAARASHDLIRALESSGHAVRVEKDERPATSDMRIEDVLWWSPREIRLPERRTVIRLTLLDGARE